MKLSLFFRNSIVDMPIQPFRGYASFIRTIEISVYYSTVAVIQRRVKIHNVQLICNRT